MKKVKKILSFLLSVFVTCMIAGTVFTNNVKADTVPVQLYYSQYVQTAILDGSCYQYNVTGYVAVQKSSASKNISIHYSTDNGVNWQDINAVYVKDNPSDGCEVWKFNINLQGNPAVQFAIRDDSNGVSYWDNNQGKNYFVSPSHLDTFGKSQLYTTAFNYETALNGGIAVIGSVQLNNIGYAKSVTIRYSYDNWATYSDTNAIYNRSSNDSSEDYWNFNIPSNLSAKQVSFAVGYTVDGVQYWDNNFGSNYTLNRN